MDPRLYTKNHNGSNYSNRTYTSSNTLIEQSGGANENNLLRKGGPHYYSSYSQS